ncbi:hypothetical protein [Humibacter sp. RRB41]|uniref:hypothetical protein n=1 Tax=Humibacter sp. RRB41 TaxID=2919946 RepID=UPI001FAB33B1|nr:hypothetical protein [Humibacter sp. RRB41]
MIGAVVAVGGIGWIIAILGAHPIAACAGAAIPTYPVLTLTDAAWLNSHPAGTIKACVDSTCSADPKTATDAPADQMWIEAKARNDTTTLHRLVVIESLPGSPSQMLTRAFRYKKIPGFSPGPGRACGYPDTWGRTVTIDPSGELTFN